MLRSGTLNRNFRKNDLKYSAYVEFKQDSQSESVTNPSKIREALKVYLGISKANPSKTQIKFNSSKNRFVNEVYKDYEKE